MWAALALWALAVVGGQGEELWRAGRRGEALEVWAAELAARPEDRELRSRLAEAELAVHRYLAALEHARALGPEARRLRGTALFRLGRFEEALGELGRGSAEELAMRVDALEALARFEEADRDAAELSKLSGGKDARVLALLGRGALRRSEREAAEPLFRAALAVDPCEPTALFGLGTLLARTGRPEEGRALLEEHRRVTPLLDRLDFARRSVDLAPQHGPNHAAVADAERDLGRIDAALAAYEVAARLCAADELAPVVLRQARLWIEARKDVDGAVALLDAAHDRCGDVRLLVRAGDVLLEAGRAGAACEKLEAAAKQRPGDAEIVRRLEKARAAR